MRCASVSIGIVEYGHEHYRTSTMRLRFAKEDAFAFHRYAATAWDDPADVHWPLTDGEASVSAVDQAFLALSSWGHFDLLLVYLSGHGEVDAGEAGWFCLADARPGTPSLDASLFDTFLSRVSADRVLLLIDCCYAEAVTAGMNFFSALGGRLTRIYVASARADQQAWEDEALRRSLFSDVLLRALSTGSDIIDAAGLVNLEARLLPRLREQVPLNAAALKRGAEQVPVAGGVSATETKLPTVAGQSLGRELSIGETVRRRVRQLVSAAALVAIAGLFLVDAMAYHLAVSGTGDILVRPGLRQTYGLMPFHIGRAADSGLRLGDLQPSKDDVLAALSDGSLAGFASHRDEQGLRPWLTRLERALHRAKHASTTALTTGRLKPFQPDDDAAPVDEAVFLAHLTGQSIEEIATRIYPLERKVTLDCAASANTHRDFTHLLAPTRTFELDAAWYAVTASEDATRRASRVADLARLAAYRATDESQSSEERAAEFRAYAGAVWTLYSTAADRPAFARAATAEFALIERGWCSDHARLGLAMLAETPDQYEATLVEAARPAFADTPGRSPTPAQQLAYLSLVELGARGLLANRAFGLTEDLLRADGFDLCSDTPTPAFLKQVARSQRLPASLTAALLDRMHAPPAEHDFRPVCAFATLSENARFLPSDALSQVQQWALKNASQERTMSDFHRGLGYLATLGGMSPAHREILAARLSPTSRFPASAVNYRGEMIITAGDEDALVAFGRAAQRSDLPDIIAERLANAAMARPLLQDRSEIVLGLGAQWYRAIPSSDLAEAIGERIETARENAERRSFEEEVAAVRVSRQTLVERKQILSSLLDRWRQTQEPEIRVALARTISRAARSSRPDT